MVQRNANELPYTVNSRKTPTTFWLISGGILKGLRRRKMCIDLPQPIGKNDENDDRNDLVDSTLSQFWRFRPFAGRWR